MPSDLSFEDHARIKSRQHRGEKQNEQRSEDPMSKTAQRLPLSPVAIGEESRRH